MQYTAVYCSTCARIQVHSSIKVSNKLCYIECACAYNVYNAVHLISQVKGLSK